MKRPSGELTNGNGRTLSRRPWIVFAAAFLPLLLLLALQYRWLERLQRVSAVAHRATLENYLEAVAAGVEVHYRSLGERALNLPAAHFHPGAHPEGRPLLQEEGDRRRAAALRRPLVGKKAG